GPVSTTVSLFVLGSSGTWNSVATTTSDATNGGYYSFGGLPAGTYKVVIAPPPVPIGYYYVGTFSTPGFQDGTQDTTALSEGEDIAGITMGGSSTGTDYDFWIDYERPG